MVPCFRPPWVIEEKQIGVLEGPMTSSLVQFAIRSVGLTRRKRSRVLSDSRLPLWKARRILGTTVVLLLAGVALQGLDSKPKPGSPPATTSPPSAPKHLPALQFDSNAPLHHLNQVISWYRQATTGISSVGLPSDTIYQDNAKTLGAQVVKLAFQSARAEAALIKTQQKITDATQTGAGTT